MKTLSEKDVIRMMQEEWEGRLKRLSEKMDVVFKAKLDGKESTILSPELKLVHSPSGLRYTVSSVGANDCILLTPEGEEFIVDKGTLEDEYEID